MKTVKVEFPIQEAVEALRLLRGEARCLIEQTEFMPEIDIQKRINHILSARERIVTALEDIASTEDVIIDPSQIAMNIPTPAYKRAPTRADSMLSTALEAASGEAPIAAKHGVVMPNGFNNSQPDYWGAECAIEEFGYAQQLQQQRVEGKWYQEDDDTNIGVHQSSK